MVEKRLSICRALRRKRGYLELEPSRLKRCLNRWDVTALGVGSTLGIGVYLIMGNVALKLAGPSVVLSFLIAAVMALLAGLCYAEFGARVPLAGSSYVYTYVTFGELAAFLVGWTNILEFVFGAATIAKGLSSYIDVLTNHTLSEWYSQTMPLPTPLSSSYFDLLSFLIVVVFGVLLSIGARQTSMINNMITLVNLVVIIFIIIAGAIKADSSNWKIPKDQVPAGFGDGGFFPHGVWGTLRGAAVCFYGFAAFDVVNSAGEEVKDPRRTIPSAILLVLLTMFVAYSAVSVVVTMMVPYYEIVAIGSVSAAFNLVGWGWAWWIVIVGSIIGICSSLFGALYPLTRLMYSMASDGLLVHWLSKVSTRRKSPIIATALSTIIIAILSAMLDLEHMVLMVCIGTLGSYTIVAISVVLLRYQSNYVSMVRTSLLQQIIGCGDKIPTKKSKLIINIMMTLYICLCVSIAVVIIFTGRSLAALVTLHVLLVMTIIIMVLQPACKEELYFKTPLVPLLPCISIYANIHLMAIISWHTWVRLLIWLAIGIPIYLICVCCYTQNASEKIKDDDSIKPYVNENGKTPVVQIVVESPTPPSTIARSCSHRNNDHDMNTIQTETVPVDTNKTEQILLQDMSVENNLEKEAKIIDLLDQVLQAEEDSYSEIISLKENKEDIVLSEGGGEEAGNIPHRKSLSELSDAESDVSLGNQVLSKYDVIAQVHREDLPKVNEEEERCNSEDIPNEDEEITAFNESETNSRTDESGYSDTTDRPILSDSLEDTNIVNIPVPTDENYFKATPIDYTSNEDKAALSGSLEKVNAANIPIPPPFDENYFSKSTPTTPYGYVDARPMIDDKSEETNVSNIPVPPPFNEQYFSKSTPATPIAINTKKFNTINSRHSKLDLAEDDENDREPRVSIQSNSSQGDGHNMRFGSSRQMKFMSKLNDIFQKTLDNEEEEPKKRRSQSTCNVIDGELSAAENRERQQIFMDLKRELLSRESMPNLRPVNIEEIDKREESVTEQSEEEEKSMSRQDLKSKLETIFAFGGPQLLAKPRLMKSNPPTPEDSYQTDVSSTESIPKTPKIERNDTLKRQKEKFGLVLHSIRLNHKDDEV